MPAFPWAPGAANANVPPPRRINVTPPRAKDGSSRSPLSVAIQDAKDKVKIREEARDTRTAAKEAAVAAARRITERQNASQAIPAGSSSHASLQFQEQLHLLLQAAQSTTSTGAPSPSLDPLIHALRMQITSPQVAHQNGPNQDPADVSSPGLPALRSQGPPSQGGIQRGQE